MMMELTDICLEYLIWTNSGNWIEFMPKLTWYNPDVYITDPHPRGYLPGLNMLKYLADCRREQMVTVHERYFVPYRFFCNCEYYFARRSRINDLRVFEYSLLQGLAVTPNICLCEIRTFLDRVPSNKKDYCISFIKKWLDFIRRNYHYWKRTSRVGGMPGNGCGEIYSHIYGDSGYICIVNENPYGVKTGFTLDKAIGLEKGSKFIIYEVFPGNNPIVEQSIPYASFGDKILLDIMPYEVKYLQIKLYETDGSIVAYGLPAGYKRVEDGYEIFLNARQGEKKCWVYFCLRVK